MSAEDYLRLREIVSIGDFIKQDKNLRLDKLKEIWDKVGKKCHKCEQSYHQCFECENALEQKESASVFYNAMQQQAEKINQYLRTA